MLRERNPRYDGRYRPPKHKVVRIGTGLSWRCRCGTTIPDLSADTIAEAEANFREAGWSREPMTMHCLCPTCTKRLQSNVADLAAAATAAHKPAPVAEVDDKQMDLL